MHFEALSNEEVQQVFRNMNKLPFSEKWKRFVEPEDVVSLLRMGGRFADAARERFQSLEILEEQHFAM